MVIYGIKNRIQACSNFARDVYGRENPGIPGEVGDLVIEEPDLHKTIYIDVTRANTLTKSNQDSLATDDAVKLRRRAYNEMKKAKYLLSQVSRRS